MNQIEPRDTIFALSSGLPPAAIAVVRVSGPGAARALKSLAGRVPSPRHAMLARLRDPANQSETLDRALILFFPAPGSATGEDLAELHLHGGRAVVAVVERALAELPGLRKAEAGEFTRRAFANGRLDLAEAEGLADLLRSETEGQRRNALLLAEGSLSRSVRVWRETLLGLAAELEAGIDFADEDDVPDDDGQVAQRIGPLRESIEALLRHPPAERLRDGIRVAIGGPPNAGKSSLFNNLVGREAALATPVPGTTRDLIEIPVQLDGLPFLFIDTAGLRETEDQVEALGVDRAHAAIEAADILLWLGDPGEAPRADAILVHPRCDLPDRSILPNGGGLAVSIVTQTGLQELRALIVSRGTELLPRAGELALVKRQREALIDCVSALADIPDTRDVLIVAEALRAARAALDRLSGEAGVEPLLDAIFGQFCIGK